MKLLDEILEVVQVIEGEAKEGVAITGLAIDSRQVKDGNLFIAIAGLSVDGHDYIDMAISKGAAMVLVTNSEVELQANCLRVIYSENLLGDIANQFYDFPSENLEVVGITGTNGKTTVGTIMHETLTKLGRKCGLISTVKILIGEEEFKSKLTTPDALTLHRLFAEMRDAGCTHVVMEVSSHAIHQNRISRVDFDYGIFTNISHDHLDYHNSFSEYIRVKKMFFDSLKPEAIAIVNIDDKNGSVMLQNTKSVKIHYALKRNCEYKARLIDSTMLGLHLVINGNEGFYRLLGTFNAYNLLAVYACLSEMSIADEIDLLSVLTQVRPPEGRFDVVKIAEKNALAVVDYAHTPDALENVLKTIKGITKSQIVTICGCGGDRDKSKRPAMAAIAAKLSDKVILTSDNPRTEDPIAILDDMEAGIEKVDDHRVFRVEDRAQAIKMGLMLLGREDVLLVAGKGHEKYQEINGVKHPFDDKRKIMEFSIR